MGSLDFRSDFIGFTFRGYHSYKDLGFYRVSEGSRYSDALVPTFQDKTVQVPGGDGTYFFESNYTQKTFAINIAFDTLTELQYRKLRQTFDKDAAGVLVFDETPYKGYYAKVQSPPQLKYICFDEDGQRIYKGEGTINFICYYPFAHSMFSFLNEYDVEDPFMNKNEWAVSCEMKERNNGTYNAVPSYDVKLYNPGDLPTDFSAYYSISSFPSQIKLEQGRIDGTRDTIGVLNFSQPVSKGESDTYIRISSYSHLLEGCDAHYNTTGTLYNGLITSGEFFKIPLGDDIHLISDEGKDCYKIEYDFLYY